MGQSGFVRSSGSSETIDMIKTITARTEDAAYSQRRRRSSGLLFLVVKNILFWGAIGLSCYGIYRLIAYLLG